jgi:large subunit ribosomal protein L9
MKVILRSDRKGLGHRGDIVDVSDGHARNFLLPKGLAIKASEGAVAQASAMRRARDLRDANDRDSARTVATALVAKTITVTAKAGSGGKLFGSVTSADVVAAIADQAGITLDRRTVHLDPVKALGTHSASIKLHADVEFPVTIEVVGR